MSFIMFHFISNTRVRTVLRMTAIFAKLAQGLLRIQQEKWAITVKMIRIVLIVPRLVQRLVHPRRHPLRNTCAGIAGITGIRVRNAEKLKDMSLRRHPRRHPRWNLRRHRSRHAQRQLHTSCDKMSVLPRKNVYSFDNSV